jgi:hypothetical protein
MLLDICPVASPAWVASLHSPLKSTPPLAFLTSGVFFNTEALSIFNLLPNYLALHAPLVENP